MEEEFHQARSDPAVALLKEPLPDSGGFGITVLSPARRSLWSQWTVGKQVPEITPPNLRNRSWADFPPTEVRRVRSRPAPFRPDPDVLPSPPEKDSRSGVWDELWKRGVWSVASAHEELP